MTSYLEYPIRCPNCNEQIAAFSKQYQSLLDMGNSVEEALNNLGIRQLCSRIAMMNPTTVFFHIDDRDVVNGIKLASVVDVEIPLPKAVSPRLTRQNLGGMATFVQTSLNNAVPIGQGVSIQDLNIKPTNETVFKAPETVGLSVINTDVLLIEEVIPVGNNMTTKVLNGRTYLAE